jgi:hypothetical protein
VDRWHAGIGAAGDDPIEPRRALAAAAIDEHAQAGEPVGRREAGADQLP